jgi:hypothetical protein
MSYATPQLCPLCGKANACAMQAERATGLPQPPCWCTKVEFDPRLLEQVPVAARGRACLCPDCAAGRGINPAGGLAAS